MKILHTSDWHLGRSLYGRKRYDEFTAFLDWLSSTIENERIDTLLVAGDIFDTSTPSNRAQELYYRFLCKVANSCCRYIVIIAGNHDSPTFLNAPKELLRTLNVYVVGSITEYPEDEVFILNNENRDPEAIICAVPYLRDKDIRTVEVGETVEDKNAKLISGLRNHYKKVCAIAGQLQEKFAISGKHEKVPIIAMGHLFAAGGKTTDGDGVRELYVGSLAHIGGDSFPKSVDYLALGHLHVPQRVGGLEHIRYSGSPIPMGYGEASQEKKVLVIEFENTKPVVQEVLVPCFQLLKRIAGSLDTIHESIEKLKAEDSNAWLEIEYTGNDIVSNLRETIEESLDGSCMEVLRIKNRWITDRVINTIEAGETLDDLDVNDVFERCLDIFEIPPEDRIIMTQLYGEIIHSINEEDGHAE